MTAILASTITREFSSLAEAHAAAAAQYEADSVVYFVAAMPFGYVGITADGRADLLETGIRCGQPVVFA